MISLLIHPERRRPNPPALRVDLRPVVFIGMGLWAVALVVSMVLLAVGRATYEAPATCGAGVLLGVAGLMWERRHRAEYRGPQ
ncbi:DUF2530 domain-containing protein [Oerskovia sp. M15]